MTGTGPGLVHCIAAGWLAGWVWNRTNPFLQATPRPLADCWDPLLTLSLAEVQYMKARYSSLKGGITVILFTVRILGPDDVSLRYDPMVGISIFYLAIKSQTFKRSGAVIWLTVILQPMVEFDKYTVNEYILIISK